MGMGSRARLAGVVMGAALLGSGMVMTGPAQAAASPTFGSSMTRAPYVTDLNQTSAEVNWATSVGTSAGSVEWVDATGTSCPTTTPAWSSTTGQVANATTQIPYGNGTTGWQFTVGGTPEYQNSAQMTGLVAGHLYCYAVFSAASVNAVDLLQSPPYQSFTTLSPVSPASTTPVSFDVIGDTGENYQDTTSTTVTPFSAGSSLNPYQSDLYSEIGSDGSKFLLEAGDVSYTGGTEQSYGDLNQTAASPQTSEISNIFGPTYLPQASGIPTFISDGNHGQDADPLKIEPEPVTVANSGGTYALDSYSGIDGISTQSPDDWYAFSTSNVRIYVLDAAWGNNSIGTASSMYQADADEHWQPSSPEYQWLQKDLTNPAYSGMIKMAVFHFPLKSDSNTEGSDTYLQQDLEPLLAQNGVAIAFNGHDHNYQRYDPPAGNGQIVSYVTGGGGGVLEPVLGGGTCQSFAGNGSVYALGWSPTGSSGSTCVVNSSNVAPTLSSPAQVFSYLHVTVTGGQVQVEGVNAEGQSFDPMTYQFSPVTTPPGGPGSGGPAPTPPTAPAPPAPPAPSSVPPSVVVGMASTPAGRGYWLVGANGGISAFGDAAVYGSMGGTQLNQPIVGMASTPDGRGYWLVAADGGIFSFGDAAFYGSTGNIRLNQPIVGMTSTPSGHGYWFVAADGGIFSFGDAAFYGWTGNIRLNRPVVGMTATPDGRGYYLSWACID